MEIARIAETDLPAISRLHMHFWGQPSDIDAMAQTLLRLSDKPDYCLLAARSEGACIGTATGVVCHGLYGGADAYLVIEDVVVDPAHRRKGVATALLDALEQFARDQCCVQVILLTESVRADAVALYASRGYEQRWSGFKKKLRNGV